MRASVRLGRIAGIPVGMHWSLLMVLGLLTYDLSVGLPGATGVVAVTVAAVVALSLFASVLAHEVAHSVIARRYGVHVDGITLWMLGGVARLDGEIPSAGAQLRIAIAGPAVSAGLAAAFGVVALVGGALEVPAVLLAAVGWLALVNLVVAVFNLIPAAPLDGGRVLAAALWAHHGDRDRANVGAARAGRAFGWFLVVFGIWGFAAGTGAGGLWSVLLGWFVLGAAGVEGRAATLRHDLRGMRVRDAMTPAPEPHPGWITVDAFLERFVNGSAAGALDEHDPDAFVIERWEGGTVGVVTLERLLAVAPGARHSTRVVELAIPIERLRVAALDDDLATAWSAPGLGSSAVPHLAVVDHGRVVGVVTPEGVRGALVAAFSRGRP
jgi:Zn-dependent protease